MRVLHNLCALLLPYHSLKFGHEPYPLIVQVGEHRLRMLVPQHLVDVADLLPEVLHLLRRLHLWERVHRRAACSTEGNVRTLTDAHSLMTESHAHAHAHTHSCPTAPVRQRTHDTSGCSRCALDYALRVERQHAHACAWWATSRATADDCYASLDAEHLAWEARKEVSRSK